VGGGLKSIIPLIVGGALLVAAVLGFAIGHQRGNRSASVSARGGSSSAPAGSRVSRHRSSPLPQDAPPPAALSAQDLAVQDEEDINRILLAQIELSPRAIDQKWMNQVFLYVRNRAQLDALVEEVLVHGARYNTEYIERKRGSKQRLSTNPQFYIWEAQNVIWGRYKGGLTEQGLSKKARGLLAMGLYRAYENARKDEEEVDDEAIAVYFVESDNAYRALEELAEEEKRDPGVWMLPHVRFLEAAIVSRYLVIQKSSQESRQQLSGTSSSGLPGRLQIAKAQKSLYVHLLHLGQLYIEAATREVAYKGKQQEHAQRGFKTLALVHRQTKSGDALRMLRESNRIQRYNLWQMARASWRQAREESKKPVAAAEYRRLQRDIAAWYAGKDEQPQ